MEWPDLCNGRRFIPHNQIATNVITEFGTSLRNADCGTYGSDLRVQTPSGLYTYPDVSVICGKVLLVPDRSDTATNPVVLVEVLSEATEEYDRGDKFTLYKSIPTLQHCILIAQTEILVDHFERIQHDDWRCHSMRDRNEIVRISQPVLSISLSDIYRRVF